MYFKFKKRIKSKHNPQLVWGFTFIEIMLVIGVVGILAVPLSLTLFNIRLAQNLNSDARLIVGTLRDAQQRSVTQEGETAWGVRFYDTGQYELCRVSGGVCVSFEARRSLSAGIRFAGFTGMKDVIFAPVTGFVTVPNVFPDTAISICVGNPCTTTKTISIQTKNGVFTIS